MVFVVFLSTLNAVHVRQMARLHSSSPRSLVGGCSWECLSPAFPAFPAQTEGLQSTEAMGGRWMLG